MAQFTQEITINATPENVWQILSDIANWTSWTPTVTKVDLLDPAPIKVGSRVYLEQPKLRPAVWQVTEWRPNQNFTWVSQSPGIRAVAEHVISREGAGARLKLVVRYEGLMGWLVGAMFGDMTKQYILTEAESLKRRVEATN